MSQVPTATNSIINAKVLNCSGNTGANNICNATLKIHPKILSNEICYSNVSPLHCASTATVISNPNLASISASPNMNATIQHGVSGGGNSGGGQFIQVIPLQIGNVATATIRAPQIIDELPLTIITKNNPMNTTTFSMQMAQQQINNGTLGEMIGGQVITTNALPVIKNNTNTILTAGTVGINNGNGTNANLANTKNSSIVPGALTVMQQTNKSVITAPASILLRNPNQKSTGKTLQRIAPGVGNVSVIHSNIDSNNVNSIIINGNSQLSASRKVYEIKCIDNNKKPMSVATINKATTHQSSSSSVEEILQNRMLANLTTNPSVPVPVAISMVDAASNNFNSANSSSVTKLELIEQPTLKNLETEKTFTESGEIISDTSNESKTVEEIEEPDSVLVIDASTDEEEADDEDIDEDESSIDCHENPMSITHISNSVVLTKAKAVDSRTNGNSRNIALEPASVVIVKVPNATQQMLTGGTPTSSSSTSNVAIPIKEALSLAAVIKNENASQEAAFNNVSTFKILSRKATNKNEARPSVLMRSNSIPEAQSKNLSPRAANRTQSLNCNQTIATIVENVEKSETNLAASSEQRRYSSPCDEIENLLVPLIKTIPKHDSPTQDSDSSSFDDELNKENNEITFIELDDDSFDESDSVHSSSSIENTNVESKPTTTTMDIKSTQKENSQQKPIFNLLDIQKSNTTSNITMDIVDTKAGISIMKDKNANSKLRNTPPKLVPFSKKSTAQSTSSNNQIVQHNLKNNDENIDQVIKTLLCNEEIPSITPSSSASVLVSAPSCLENTPKISGISSKSTIATNTTMNAQRPMQTTIRRPIDNNTAAARRVCRDSSIASALSMVSTFDMLNWKEDRIATARGTAMRFELNEFNLLQVHERGCPPRYRIHTSYERPITERTSAIKKSEQLEPLLYMCRKCKHHGPAIDFLAPEYCSVECLRRNFGKRSARITDTADILAMKRARKNPPNSSNNTKELLNVHDVPKLPKFRWSSYLATMRNAVAAPIDLFLNPFPTGPNPFRVGMKLEAIDPENCSIFCVCTIVHIQGYRLHLSFDGYDTIYDFWVNADSMDIFPPGWCALTHRILQPPRGYEPQKFDWEIYLKKTNSIAADKKFFTHLNGISMSDRNPFTVGMFLEADDLNDTGKLCVASVADVLGERVRVHFDGWDDCYDYWVDINSPYIHPCGWHEGRQQLLVPPEYGNTSFNWRDYIKESKAGKAAPSDIFVMRDAIDYRPGMKLEVVDPRNQSIIRPATIAHRTRHRIKIHLDCWPSDYTFSLEDDSPDLHPMGWCDATGHDLEPPPGYQQNPQIMPCKTIGCRGIGNVDRNKPATHATRGHCPYAPENWRTKSERIPRLNSRQIIRILRQFTINDMDPALKTYKRQHNQLGNNTTTTNPNPDPPKLLEKSTVVPFKQATRGRPRNCDRLAAQQQQEYQQRLQQQQKQQQPDHHMERRHRSLDIKSENENGIENVNFKIKIEKSVSNDKNTSPPPQLEKSSTAVAITPEAEPATIPVTTTTTVALDPKISVAKRFLCDYGPRLEQNYNLWRQNISVDMATKVQRNPLLWSTAETCAFVDAVLSEGAENAARYTISSKFYKHDIDGAALLMLQQQDLTETLQLKLGPAVKLCAIILQLRMLVTSKYDMMASKKSNAEETAIPK